MRWTLADVASGKSFPQTLPDYASLTSLSLGEAVEIWQHLSMEENIVLMLDLFINYDYKK